MNRFAGGQTEFLLGHLGPTVPVGGASGSSPICRKEVQAHWGVPTGS